MDAAPPRLAIPRQMFQTLIGARKDGCEPLQQAEAVWCKPLRGGKQAGGPGARLQQHCLAGGALQRPQQLDRSARAGNMLDNMADNMVDYMVGNIVYYMDRLVQCGTKYVFYAWLHQAGAAGHPV